MKRIISAALLGLACILSGAAGASERGTAEEAVALVKKAIAYYKANGAEKTFAEINTPNGQFHMKDLYLFAARKQAGGTTLAHGANPRLLGKPLGDLKDVDGVPFVRMLSETAASKEGKGWVDYRWPNPVTKQIEKKSTYVEAVDDIYFACGIYK